MDTLKQQNQLLPKFFKKALGDYASNKIESILFNTNIRELDKLSSDVSEEDMMDYCMMSQSLLKGLNELNMVAVHIVEHRISKIINPINGHRLPKDLVMINGKLATQAELEFVSIAKLTLEFSELLFTTIISIRNNINKNNAVDGTPYPTVATNILLDSFLASVMERFWSDMATHIQNMEYPQIFQSNVISYLQELPTRFRGGKGLSFDIAAGFRALQYIPYKMNINTLVSTISGSVHDELASNENRRLVTEDILTKIYTGDFAITEKEWSLTLADGRQLKIKIIPNKGNDFSIKRLNLQQLCKIDIYDDAADYATTGEALHLAFSRVSNGFTPENSSFALREFLKIDDEEYVNMAFYFLSLIYDSIELTKNTNTTHRRQPQLDTPISNEQDQVQNGQEYIYTEYTQPTETVTTTANTDINEQATKYEKMPAYACSTVIRALPKIDWVQHIRTRGDHYVFKNIKTGLSTVVPNHGSKTLNGGLLRKIMKTLSITPQLLKSKS